MYFGGVGCVFGIVVLIIFTYSSVCVALIIVVLIFFRYICYVSSSMVLYSFLHLLFLKMCVFAYIRLSDMKFISSDFQTFH